MNQKTLTLGLATLALPLLLSGCSGKTEDVRISLCRNLSTTLLSLQQPPTWLDQKTYIKRPSYAQITLNFQADSSMGKTINFKSACFYEYSVVEENVITHTDPLSAYSTLSYKMTLNGRNIPKKVINDATNAVVRKQGKEMLEKARKGFREAMGMIKEGIDGWR